MTTTNDVAAAAAILGRLGGSAKSAKKTAAVRKNGKLGGGVRRYPIGTTQIMRHHLRQIAKQDGAALTPAQVETLKKFAQLKRRKEPRA